MTTRSSKTKPAEEEPTTVVDSAFDFSGLTLAQRLTAARGFVGGGVEKKGKNTSVGEGYSFVKASDVARAVGDALARAGVYALPSYEEMGHGPVQYASRSGTNQFLTRLKVTVTFMKVEDKATFSINTPQVPETMTITTVGYGVDNSDKGPYKAMTGGLKYAQLHALGLATDDDPENEHAEAAPRPERKVGPQSASAADAAPAETTPVGDDPNAPITSAQSRLIFAKAGAAGLGQDEFRTLVYLITNKRSSRDLVSKEVDAILAGLQDEAIVARAKSGDSAAEAPATPEAPAKADEITAEAVAQVTGGEIVP